VTWVGNQKSYEHLEALTGIRPETIDWLHNNPSKMKKLTGALPVGTVDNVRYKFHSNGNVDTQGITIQYQAEKQLCVLYSVANAIKDFSSKLNAKLVKTYPREEGLFTWSQLEEENKSLEELASYLNKQKIARLRKVSVMNTYLWTWLLEQQSGYFTVEYENHCITWIASKKMIIDSDSSHPHAFPINEHNLSCIGMTKYNIERAYRILPPESSSDNGPFYICSDDPLAATPKRSSRVIKAVKYDPKEAKDESYPYCVFFCDNTSPQWVPKGTFDKIDAAYKLEMEKHPGKEIEFTGALPVCYADDSEDIAIKHQREDGKLCALSSVANAVDFPLEELERLKKTGLQLKRRGCTRSVRFSKPRDNEGEVISKEQLLPWLLDQQSGLFFVEYNTRRATLDTKETGYIYAKHVTNCVIWDATKKMIMDSDPWHHEFPIDEHNLSTIGIKGGSVVMARKIKLMFPPKTTTTKPIKANSRKRKLHAATINKPRKRENFKGTTSNGSCGRQSYLGNKHTNDIEQLVLPPPKLPLEKPWAAPQQLSQQRQLPRAILQQLPQQQKTGWFHNNYLGSNHLGYFHNNYIGWPHKRGIQGRA
jgi:hypothetical protein